jgi:hypothetical protein
MLSMIRASWISSGSGRGWARAPAPRSAESGGGGHRDPPDDARVAPEGHLRRVGRINAFVGMQSEPHGPGDGVRTAPARDVKQQFEALRDGDRFFYRNDPELARIGEDFGITYRHTLAEIISLNSGARVPADVFEVAPSDD